MPGSGQFTVPQFIDAEDKIIGPVTLRQFIIMVIAFLTDGILWQLLNFVPFLLVGIPVIVFGGIVAFTRINGQPFHYFVLNIVQTFRKPRLRVWDKKLTNAQLKVYVKKKIVAPPPPLVRKPALGSSRLKELSLLVNTGGTYNPEENN